MPADCAVAGGSVWPRLAAEATTVSATSSLVTCRMGLVPQFRFGMAAACLAVTILKGGARVGWMPAGRYGFANFRARVEGKKGEIPAFAFSRWTDGVVGKLPQPERPFGLNFRGTQVTEAGLKQLATLRQLQALSLLG